MKLRTGPVIASALKADVEPFSLIHALDRQILGIPRAYCGHIWACNTGQLWSLLVTLEALQSKGFRPKFLERATRIELAFSAWEADVLPLNYARGESNDNAGMTVITTVE